MSAIKFDAVLGGPGEGAWVHTHGMDEYGLPELEIRGIPNFLIEPAANILHAVTDYMLDSGKVIALGESFAVSDQIVFTFTKAVPLPGEEDHYDVERWLIADLPPNCLCERCRAEAELA